MNTVRVKNNQQRNPTDEQSNCYIRNVKVGTGLISILLLNHNNSSLETSFNGKCLVGMKFFARATPHHYLLWLLSILYNLLEEPGNVLRIPNYIQPCNDTCQRLNIWHSKLEMKAQRKERFTEFGTSPLKEHTFLFVLMKQTGAPLSKIQLNILFIWEN